jgi:hypothetical protein
MPCISLVAQTWQVKINLTDELGIKADDQRGRNIQTFFMAGQANRFFYAKHKLVPTIFQLNTVGTAQ